MAGRTLAPARSALPPAPNDTKATTQTKRARRAPGCEGNGDEAEL